MASMCQSIEESHESSETSDGMSKRRRYLLPNTFDWRNTNFEVLSQVMNILALSDKQADLLLHAVCACIAVDTLSLKILIQITKLNSAETIPACIKELRNEEMRVLSSAKLRTCDLNTLQRPKTRKGNIEMICPGQDITCISFDIWDVVQDLLNDGDHPAHANFKFKPEFTEKGDRVYNELWTSEWWREQHVRLGSVDKNVLAIIPYMDETPVTFNGRNMHPVYVSLGNKHVSFR